MESSYDQYSNRSIESTKVALILPRIQSSFRYLWNVEHTYAEALGIGILAKKLEDVGHSVEIFDLEAGALTTSEVVARIIEGNFKMVGISVTSGLTYENSKSIANQLKSHGWPGIILCGGPFITTGGKERALCQHQFDVSVLGPGEDHVVSCANAISQSKPLPENEVVIWRKDSPIVRKRNSYTNSISFEPLRYNMAHMLQTYSMVPILASRGCVFQCNYCASCLAKEGWTPRPLREVINELMSLHHTYGAIRFAFMDEDLCGPHKDGIERIHELAVMLKDLQIPNLSCSFQTRPDSILKLDLNLIYSCGLNRLCTGIDSIHDRALDLYGRGYNGKTALCAIDHIMKNFHGHWRASYILFNPFSMQEDLLSSLDFLARLKSHIQIRKLFSKLLVFEMTPLKTMLESRGVALTEGPEGFFEYSFVDPFVDTIWRQVRWFEIEREELFLLLSKVQDARGGLDWMARKNVMRNVRSELWDFTLRWLRSRLSGNNDISNNSVQKEFSILSLKLSEVLQS